ncbi:MAG: nicotinate-nucleotide adenylyltransferase [Cyanobacteria bacterium J069]|nr:MAG: nicotinate-nucleotide adenylyltransferase [Cyanobacteria bacterium J069]
MHIALFGTSADPPTKAHQDILVWLAEQFDEVAVWASNNPFKSHQTPLEHRTAMLRLMVAEIRPIRRNLHVYPDLSHPRALVTVNRARRRWKQATFTLVVGSDLVAQLPKWYRVEALLRDVDLLVVPRPGYPLRDADLEPLRQLGATVAIAPHQGIPASSTAYRTERDPHLLIPPIEAYIHQQRLYTPCQDDPHASLVTPSHSS